VARLGAGALAAAATATTATAASATTATAAGPVATVAVGGLGAVAKLVGVVALVGTASVGASVALRARSPAQRTPPAVTVSTGEAQSPAPAVADPRHEPALQEEVRLLQEAQRAMRGGELLRALALVDEHARRFPDGLLRQERLAVRVLILCALGRTGAAGREAERFLREWPTSPLSSQIRASCGRLLR